MSASALLSQLWAERANPQLTAAFSAVLSKNTSLPLPTQPETRMILLYVRTGSGQITGAGQRWNMEEPSAILLPCQQSWSLNAASDLSAQLLIVELQNRELPAEKRAQSMRRMELTILESLRMGDPFTRMGADRILIMLAGADESGASVVDRLPWHLTYPFFSDWIRLTTPRK